MVQELSAQSEPMTSRMLGGLWTAMAAI